MTTVSAFAAPSAGAPLERTTIERRSLGDRDVLIEIQYVGICHTDIHQTRGHWGQNLFPMVPGHEISGIATEVGRAVTKHAVGDRVAVGFLVDSCRTCEYCRAGLQPYCTGGVVQTFNDTDKNGDRTYGGYSTHIVVDQDFVVRVPEALSLQEAAPLLCAGITVYSPLRHWRVGPGKHVAIVGLGGIGHIGVKIARTLGAEVTVLSQSLRKRDDALRLGADHYYATNDPKSFEQLAGAFDLMLSTVPAPVDLDAMLSLVKPDGVLVGVGAPEKSVSLNFFSLIFGRKSLAGSCIGGIPETQEMLDYCAEHGLGAEIELISADEINKANDRVLDSDVRYRFVIDNATI